MTPISAVIITYNEEKNIGRCLKSLAGIADDIVVMDSFSTDRTEEICLQHGVRFVKHQFDGHIEQKNRAITQAVYPHVLSLDADEAVSEDLKNSIIDVKNNWKKDGYYMNRLTNYCGKWVRHCGWYPDAKLRMWNSRKGKWTGVNPHDKFEMLDGDKVTGFLTGDILHYSYYTLDDHYRQVNYFTDISAREYFSRGKNASLLKLWASPAAKFIRDYFLKLGFLDGKTGFTISRISAYAAYLKYLKLRRLWKEKK